MNRFQALITLMVVRQPDVLLLGEVAADLLIQRVGDSPSAMRVTASVRASAARSASEKPGASRQTQSRCSRSSEMPSLRASWTCMSRQKAQPLTAMPGP